MYVDVHTHLTHEEFDQDWEAVIKRAETVGLKAIIVNGLEPQSNRRILEMAKKFPVIKPALGIYPVNAAFDKVPLDLPFKVPAFDRDAEVQFIADCAKNGKLTAIGECGLDLHWIRQDSLAIQEKYWIKLLEIGMKYDLPVIIHSRKAEQRCVEVLAHHGVKKVNFHCYGGKVKQAVDAAEKNGWYFSIPANCIHNQSFQRLLEKLPPELILTETDAPYLGPVRGERNEPKNVLGTVALLAKLRGWNEKQAQQQVWDNYNRLFAK